VETAWLLPEAEARGGIQTKPSGTNRRWQIAVGGRNYTHIDWNALSASDGLEVAFLKHP
jgi:hypothetical protein